MKFAVYDPTTGKISHYIEMAESYLEVDAFPGDGEPQKMVRDGKLIAMPVIRLAAPDTIIAGQPFNFDVTMPTDFPDPIPTDPFECTINGQIVRWLMAHTITLDEPGDYVFKIEGPWPWSSNQVRFSVEAAPVETDLHNPAVTP